MLGELILFSAGEGEGKGGEVDRYDLLQTDTTFTFVVQIILKNLELGQRTGPP